MADSEHAWRARRSAHRRSEGNLCRRISRRMFHSPAMRPIVAIRASRITTESHQTSAASVPQLRAPPRDVLPELLVHARIHRGLLVLLDRLAPDLARALGRVAPAVARPAVEVLRRAQQRPVEALAEALERVHRAEEVPARADLLVRAERKRLLVDLERRELVLQHAQQLDVDDELLVARHEPTLEPAGRVHHVVRAGQDEVTLTVT